MPKVMVPWGSSRHPHSVALGIAECSSTGGTPVGCCPFNAFRARKASGAGASSRASSKVDVAVGRLDWLMILAIFMVQAN